MQYCFKILGKKRIKIKVSVAQNHAEINFPPSMSYFDISYKRRIIKKRLYIYIDISDLKKQQL